MPEVIAVKWIWPKYPIMELMYSRNSGVRLLSISSGKYSKLRHEKPLLWCLYMCAIKKDEETNSLSPYSLDGLIIFSKIGYAI